MCDPTKNKCKYQMCETGMGQQVAQPHDRYMMMMILNSKCLTNKCTIQAGLFLRNFFLSDFNIMQLENLHHLSNLRNNVQFRHHVLAMAALDISLSMV